MTNPAVTFTGEEVGMIAGLIASALPLLSDEDFELADVLLDRALAVMPRPLAPELGMRVSALRLRPR